MDNNGRQESHKICFILFCIAQLVCNFMCGNKWFKKSGNSRIHLGLTGKWIIISLETQIISQVTE